MPASAALRDQVATAFAGGAQPQTEGENAMTACTCDALSGFDDQHTPECALMPDLRSWLFYPHDGELEDGGVYVHPTDKSCVYLLVKGVLCRAPLYEANNDAEQLPFDELELSTRAWKCLRKAGFTTAGDIARCTPQDLMQLRNFGRVSLADVRNVLAVHGLSLRAA
jgi:hypothetical protein